MTVSLPLAGMNASGGVRTLLTLANAMADRGWRVRVIMPDYAAESPIALRPSIEQVVLATPRIGAARVAAYYVRLARHAAAGADRCLASFYLTAYCAVASACTNRRARVIYFLQGDEAESHGRLAEANAASRAVRAALARISYRLPVRVICVSRWLQQRVRRPDAVVVPQGLNLDVFTPGRRRAGGEVVVGTIGSAAAAKGYTDFCAALTRLPEATRSAIRVVVAASESVPLPRGVAAERIEANGECDMAAFYNRCDLFVFASRSEGFGLPPLEAMACGCAVVTTDCGGVRDYVAPGTNALMVPVADADALGSAIAALVSDPAARDRLAAAALITSRARGREQMVAEFIDAVAA